jgi:5-(carboxyamino)imidazole ribonucleotide mutase
MKIVIIYGSENDRAYLDGGKAYLEENGLAYEEKVLSVHRNFEELSEYLDSVRTSGEKCVFLAVAGLSAALPGIVAVRTDLPVIGIPVPAALNGVDALLSIIQMPGGVPVASVGIHKKAPLNACILAHRMVKLAT